MALSCKTVVLKSAKRKLSSVWGFTLIELLVVIAVIALLLAIFMPALRKAKYQTNVVVCANNQHQILIAVQTYSSANNMKLPPSMQTGASPNFLTRGESSIAKYFTSSMPDYDPFRCPLAPFRSDDILNGTTKTFRQLYSDSVYGNPLPPGFKGYGIVGSYWLLWNYTGWETVGFKPNGMGKHNLMISDVMTLGGGIGSIGNDRHDWGFNHYNRDSIKSSTSQQFWQTASNSVPDIKQNAGYLDGHVKLTNVGDWKSFNNQSFFPNSWY